MSKQRIRRRGPDGHDRILDVDLGPSSATTSRSIGASTMGDMRPILRGGTYRLKGRVDGGGWAASRRFVITGRKRRVNQRWLEPRQNDP